MFLPVSILITTHITDFDHFVCVTIVYIPYLFRVTLGIDDIFTITTYYVDISVVSDIYTHMHS